MAFVNHEINYLIALNPSEAKERILKALRKAKLHKEDAAKILECNYGTLLRWIKRLSLETQIKKMSKAAKKEGWFHGKTGGRPIGSTVENGAAPRKKKRVKPA